MGFPPPPPNGPQPPPDQGGGFGPPQGFGPPPPPPPSGGGDYGYPQQGGGGYGYPGQGGGYGPPGPPGPPQPPPGGGYGGYGYPPPGGYPPPPPNNKKRNTWIAVGAAVVVVAVVVGVVVAGSGGGDDKPSAKDTTGTPSVTGLPTLPTPTFSLPSIDPSLDLPSADPSLDLPTDFPSFTLDPTPSDDPKVVPYVVIDPGKCFNAPTMTPSVETVTVVSCSKAHDAQVVANETLTGTFATDEDIQSKAISLCTKDARKHLPADGKPYYPYALFPKLVTYQLQGRKTVTCSLTLNDGKNGKKLYGKLG